MLVVSKPTETETFESGKNNTSDKKKCVEGDEKRSTRRLLQSVRGKIDLSYLSDILLEHTQLQALVEAELPVLPRPLHLMMTLQNKRLPSVHLSVCWSQVRHATVSHTCMTWCRTPMMPCVAVGKSSLVAELSESVAGQRWRTSIRALPLSLTCRQTGSVHTDRYAGRQVWVQTDR